MGKKRILVVDDSEAVREAVGLLLRDQADLEVCGEAVDGVDAIEKTKILSPDLILLDLAMPKLNGAAAASVLKGATPGIPIILFTMYEEAVHALAPAIGVDVVLAKPDGFSRLLERIRELLGEQPNNAAADSIKAHDKGTAATSANQN